jgi:hypothetical protein
MAISLIGMSLGVVLLAMLCATPVASANTPQFNILDARYPGTWTQGESCLVCHASLTTFERNGFGSAFENSASGPFSESGLAEIEFLDSDGDGFTNLHEILLPKSSSWTPMATALPICTKFSWR